MWLLLRITRAPLSSLSRPVLGPPGSGPLLAAAPVLNLTTVPTACSRGRNRFLPVITATDGFLLFQFESAHCYFDEARQNEDCVIRCSHLFPPLPAAFLSFFFFFLHHSLSSLPACGGGGRRHAGRLNKQASCRADSDESVLPQPPACLFLSSNVVAALAEESGLKWVCGASRQLCHP